LICSFNFLIFVAVCLNISTVININILTNSNQQTQSYKFTSHIAAFLSGFDHRDAWNLHTHIIWSKRLTDFKELSPCSVWYHLNRGNRIGRFNCSLLYIDKMIKSAGVMASTITSSAIDLGFAPVKSRQRL
jgi:hypothetical protein